MTNEIKERLRDPRFTAFQLQRQQELIEDGLAAVTAMIWAARETEGRARVSLKHGIDSALAADLVVIDQPGDAVPRFFLRAAA